MRSTYGKSNLKIKKVPPLCKSLPNFIPIEIGLRNWAGPHLIAHTIKHLSHFHKWAKCFTRVSLLFLFFCQIFLFSYLVRDQFHSGQNFIRVKSGKAHPIGIHLFSVV